MCIEINVLKFFYSYSYLKKIISRQIYQINLILEAILDFEPPYLPNLPTFFWQTLYLDSPHIEVEKKVGLNKSLGGGEGFRVPLVENLYYF